MLSSIISNHFGWKASPVPTRFKPFSKDFSCNYFSLVQQDITSSGEKITLVPENKSSPAYQTGYVSLFVLSGSGKLFSKTENKEIDIKPEDTIIVKTNEEVVVNLDSNCENLSLMKIF